MPSGYSMDDPILGTKDLDDQYITDAWLIDRFVGNTLLTWGINSFGGLGNGTVSYYSSPIQIGALTNWKQVAGGFYQTASINTDGTLWTWGTNQSGQLGTGNSTSRSSPGQIGTDTDWVNTVTSLYSTTAIKQV